ncbi:MAG TPA: nuclear transport factor 2 family protein [Gammaproteobacteria bacterium]|jgi:ketosteroid isomerase-like protein
MPSLRDTLLALTSALVLPSLSLAATHAQVSSGPPRDVAALEKRIDQWLDGYNKADVAQMMDVFSDDFSDEEQDAPSADKTQVSQAFTGLFARFDTRIVGVTDEIRVSGDLAFDRGHYTSTFTPKAGGTTFARAGRFLEVWKREGGVWRVQHIVTLHDPVR